MSVVDPCSSYHLHRWRWGIRLMPVGASFAGFGAVTTFTLPNPAIGITAAIFGLIAIAVWHYSWTRTATERSRIAWINAGWPGLPQHEIDRLTKITRQMRGLPL